MRQVGSLIRGRFKVIQELHREENYAAVRVIDIEDREKPERLLNIYTGRPVLEVVPLFERMKQCPDFVASMPDDDAFLSVFRWIEATPIDEVFYKKAKVEWDLRLKYVDQLIQLALSMFDYPPSMACELLSSHCLQIRPTEEQFHLIYTLHPPEGKKTEQDLLAVLFEQINRILPKRFGAVSTERTFVDLINAGKWKKLSDVYSAWRDAYKDIREEYEKVYAKKFLGKYIDLAKAYLGVKVKIKKGII